MAASTSLPGRQKLSFSPTKQFLGRLLLSGRLEKGRPSVIGVDLSHIVENSGGFAGVNGLNVCGRMGKGVLVIAGVFEEVRSVLID